MTPYTTSELAAIVERAEAATPGPWTDQRPGIDKETGFSKGIIIAAVAPRQGIYADPSGGSYPAADQRFIAAARADVPRLAAEVIALRKVLEPLAQIARDAATRDDLVIPNGMRVQIPLSLCRAVAALLPPEPTP